MKYRVTVLRFRNTKFSNYIEERMNTLSNKSFIIKQNENDKILVRTRKLNYAQNVAHYTVLIDATCQRAMLHGLHLFVPLAFALAMLSYHHVTAWPSRRCA